jgi:hypothetical protein
MTAPRIHIAASEMPEAEPVLQLAHPGPVTNVSRRFATLNRRPNHGYFATYMVCDGNAIAVPARPTISVTVNSNCSWISRNWAQSVAIT